MFTCQFELKKDCIPTVQLKGNNMYVPTQYLTTSKVKLPSGTEIDEPVTMCLTSVDLEIFLEHYEIYNPIWHSGWKFKSTTGLFTDYIDKWVKIKNESTINGNEAMRTLAKLMLNALYGKFALNPKVASKIPYLDEDKIVRYKTTEKKDRKPLYIPVGTFITAWARHKTITSAQKLSDGFLYADTDSVHLEYDLPESIKQLTPKELKNLTTIDLKQHGIDLPEGFEVDPVKLGAWKLEMVFYRARYIRQKSYIEDMNPPETWGTDDYDHSMLKITCAGMPASCHDLVTWENFIEGMEYNGKLQHKNVQGGAILKETTFKIIPT